MFCGSPSGPWTLIASASGKFCKGTSAVRLAFHGTPDGLNSSLWVLTRFSHSFLSSVTESHTSCTLCKRGNSLFARAQVKDRSSILNTGRAAAFGSGPGSRCPGMWYVPATTIPSKLVWIASFTFSAMTGPPTSGKEPPA